MFQWRCFIHSYVTVKRRFKKTLQPCHLVVSFGLNSVSMLKLEQLLLVFYFLLTQYMLNVPQTKIIMQTMQPSSCLEVFVVAMLLLRGLCFYHCKATNMHYKYNDLMCQKVMHTPNVTEFATKGCIRKLEFSLT